MTSEECDSTSVYCFLRVPKQLQRTSSFSFISLNLHLLRGYEILYFQEENQLIRMHPLKKV